MIKRISLEPAAIEVSDANAVPPLIFQLPPCKGREVDVYKRQAPDRQSTTTLFPLAKTK